MKKEEKGITLIALVVTIVVLLILAGVSISMLTGENGIITQSKRSAIITNLAMIEEKKNMDTYDTYLENIDIGSKLVTEKVDRYDIDEVTKSYIKDSQGAIGIYAIDWDYVYYLDFEKADINVNINLGDINESNDIEHSIIYDLKGKNLIYNKGISYEGEKFYNYKTFMVATNSTEDSEDIILSEEELKKQKIYTSLNDQTYVVNENGDCYSVGKVDDTNMIGMEEYVDIQNEILMTEYKLDENEQICIGSKTTYILKKDGTVQAIGENAYGQLGIGNTESRNEFTKVLIENVKQIPETVFDTMVFLTENGDVYACGKNFKSYVQREYWLIKENGEQYYSTPIKIEGISNVEKILWVSDFEIIVMKEDGSVWMWGSDCYGQFGLGSVQNSRGPTEITGIKQIAESKGTKVKDVQSRITTIALLENGEVYTCGYGYYNGLGNGSLANQYTFGDVIISNIKEVFSNGTGTYVLNNNGEVFGWGGNSSLGTEANKNGTITSVSTPSKVLIDNIIKISYKVAITSDGNIYWLGLDKNNKFNNLIKNDTSIKDVYSVDTGESFFIDDLNRIWAFGGTSKNMLLGDYAYRSELYKTCFSNVDEIYANDKDLIYKTKNNEYYGIGKNYRGILGFGNDLPVNMPTKLNLSAATPFRKVTLAKGFGSCGYIIDNNGEIWTSGTHSYGEQNYFKQSMYYEKIDNPIGGINCSEIYAGDSHYFIKSDDGNLYAIGTSEKGNLGDGKVYMGTSKWTKVIKNVNGNIIDFNDAKQITEIQSYTYVLMNDGYTIYCWGPNENGQLGLGYSSTQESSPKEMTYFKENNIKVKEIITGIDFTVFLTETNEIYTVGNNSYGQLGIGSYETKDIPVKVDISDVDYVCVGNGYVIAVKNNGEIYSWGNNLYGQCGNKNLGNLLNPTKAIELMKKY